MIPIKEIHDDIVLDAVNTAENGSIGMQMYTRLSRRGENRLFDYLTGSIEGVTLPTTYTSQKLKDILAPFIIKFSAQVVNGKITRPENYYTYDSLVILGNYGVQQECEENESDEIIDGCNTPIEVLDSAQFDARCQSFIEGLQPSFTKPIARLVGNTFEFMPRDIGSVELTYVRYPVYAKIVPKMDTVYNEEVIDEALSTNYEESEFARELLIFFISDAYANHTREQALKTFNAASGKVAHP